MLHNGYQYFFTEIKAKYHIFFMNILAQNGFRNAIIGSIAKSCKSGGCEFVDFI